MKLKLFISAILLFAISVIANAQQITQVKSTEVASLLKKNSKIVILDVRTPAEFSDGHLKGAINIDIKDPDALAKIDKLNHNAVYLVHCKTSHRSKIAVDHMVLVGFKSIYQMSDGYTGWIKNKLEIQK